MSGLRELLIFKNSSFISKQIFICFVFYCADNYSWRCISSIMPQQRRWTVME